MPGCKVGDLAWVIDDPKLRNVGALVEVLYDSTSEWPAFAGINPPIWHCRSHSGPLLSEWRDRLTGRKVYESENIESDFHDFQLKPIRPDALTTHIDNIESLADCEVFTK